MGLTDDTLIAAIKPLFKRIRLGFENADSCNQGRMVSITLIADGKITKSKVYALPFEIGLDQIVEEFS